MFEIFSSRLRLETQFRHDQGHQRASASTSSFNIFQSTLNTVYEVESRKTVNTKFGKQTISFSEVIEEFHQYFQKNKLQDTKW